MGSGNESWEKFTESSGLQIGFSPKITQTRNGDIWTVSGHGLKGVNRFNGARWTTTELRSLGGDDHNYAILETEDQILWIGGNKGYLHAYQNDRWSVYHPPAVPLPEIYIVDLLQASDGALWIAGIGQEAVRVDYGTSRWTTFAELHFQGETSDGTQWFLSEDGSILRRKGENWHEYQKDDLIDHLVALMTTRTDQVWIAGSHKESAATAVLENGKWTRVTHSKLS